MRKYQKASKHPVADGKVGPNTRKRLVNDLLAKHNHLVFGRMRKYSDDDMPTVFISYASEDRTKVDKIDQWLRDKNVHVLRDVDLFVAGHTVEENIRSAVARADKILAVYSKRSRSKDWPRLELALGEELERRIDERILIYLRLDDSPLPAHDPTRLAIDGSRRSVREVGDVILHSLIGGHGGLRQRLVFDEDTPL